MPSVKEEYINELSAKLEKVAINERDKIESRLIIDDIKNYVMRE